MADVIAGFSVPHTPYFPVTLPKDPDGLDSRCFARTRQELEAVAPDLIVAFAPDHLSTFFYDNLPTFAIGAVDELGGPNDKTPGVPYRRRSSRASLGTAIHAHCLSRGFDPSLSQKLEVDHSVTVPLHFLEPEGEVPLVPVFINGIAPPIPTGERALALGRAVGEALRQSGENLRIAVLASGSINHEVAGPRVLPGEVWAAPDPTWLDHVLKRLHDGEIDQLASEATPEKLASVGNVAGELLTVIAMLGALGEASVSFLESQPRLGHAYGVWNARP